ncbi:NAD(P)-binding domain-containing protein [Sulfitobacter aestuarii]|uniref:NAD(P)-binding domain-containing protein n=1 Tax=Sulfitobacter aestuarii TaxID=2161676 RepID=A0ABW5U5W4_9RHOB
MKIGVIGTGTIASALVEGLAGQGHRITVSERSATHATRLAAQFDEVTIAPNQSVLDDSEVIFIGLMANAAADVLNALAFRADHRVVSLMAGPVLDEVAQMVAPARAEAVMIPFPGIARGGSPVLALGQVDLLHALFGDRNTLYELSTEAELAAYICAQAVLSPAALLVAEAADWLGERVAERDQGEAFLRLLVGSSLLGTESRPLLAALDTPGGFNQRLREDLRQSGMVSALKRALDRLEGNA